MVRVAALDVFPEVGQGAFVEQEELGMERLVRFSLEDLQKKGQLGDFHRLRVDVHAKDIVIRDVISNCV